MRTFTAIVALVAMLSVANAKTIYEVATTTSDLTILVEAAKAANLTAPLMDPDAELTVFAPYDIAFEELLSVLEIPAEDLLADPETLATLLQYHIVPTVAFTSDLSDGQVLPTLLGPELIVTIEDGTVYITPTLGPRAMVSFPDVSADNGVVHIIDTVLLPAATTAEADSPTVESLAAPTTE